MSEEIDSRLREIFIEAVEIEDASARVAFLNAACESDRLLRQRVEELLAADGESGGEVLAAGSREVQPETVGERIGRYRLLKKVGEGGCGIVFMAEQEEPVRREVAIKVIKLGMDTRQVVARFEAERQALALMDHPNIARVLDVGATDSGRPYFVMELVRGVKITDYCDQHRLSSEQRLELVIQICQAVQHAHQKGIIHRDLKPSNILVTELDGKPLPKVIDFGIAKAVEGRLTDQTLYTAFEQFLGTPAYMSPEQAHLGAVDIDTRSDIYSLGVLLYELLTGRTPFDQKELLKAGLNAMTQIIREQEPPRPSTRLSTLAAPDLTGVAQLRSSEPPRLMHLVRGDLDWIVMKCLEKDRARRYDTATGLAADLKRHLAHEPVQARPRSKLYEFQKTVRRHKFGFAASTALAVILAAGVLVSTLEAVRARRAEFAQTRARNEAVAARGLAERQRLVVQQNLYAADVRQAALLLDQDDLGLALEVLNRHVPTASQTNDFRGFEWRYLWQRCQGDPHENLPRVNGWPWWLDFSSDGKYLAVAVGSGKDAHVTVLNFLTREVVATLEKQAGTGTDSDPACAVFTADGQRLVTACHNRVKFFETTGWNELPAMTLENVSGPIAIHGNTLVTMPTNQLGSDKQWKEIQIWDLAEKRVIRTLTNVDGPPVLSPEGQSLVTDSPEGLRVWPLDKPASPPLLLAGSSNLLSHLSGYQDLRKSVAFAPDGQRIAGAGHSGDIPVMVWDAATGTRLDQNRLVGHQSHISALTWSPDSHFLATCSADRTIRVWDLEQFKMRKKLVGHLGEPWSIAYEPHGAKLVSGSLDSRANHLKVWSLDFGEEPSHNETAEWFPCWLSRDGRRVVAVTTQCGLKYWNWRDGQGLKFVPAPEGFSLAGVSAFGFCGDPESPKGAFAGLTNGFVAAYLLIPTRFPRMRRVHAGRVTAVVSGPEGRVVVTGGEDGRICWWDLSSGALIHSNALPDQVSGLALTPDGQVLVSASGNKKPSGSWSNLRLCWWTAESGRLVSSNSIGEIARTFEGMGFSPDGKTLAVSVPDGQQTLLVNAATKETHILPARARGIVFSPDGSKILTTSSGPRMWNVCDATPFGEELKGNRQMVFEIAFSPDGKTIVSTCDDGTVRLWNVATQREVLTLFERGRVWGRALFSADGSTLAVGNFAATDCLPVRFWQAPSFKEIDELRRTGRDNH